MCDSTRSRTIKHNYAQAYASVRRNPGQDGTNQNAGGDLPQGYFYFLMQALKFHLACDMTAQEVHDLGQNEVKRIRSRMDKVRKYTQ